MSDDASKVTQAYVPNWVMHCHELKDSAKLLLIYVMCCKGGEWRGSLGMLCGLFDKDRKTIKACLQALSDGGFAMVHQEGRYTVTISLNFDAMIGRAQTFKTEHPAGGFYGTEYPNKVNTVYKSSENDADGSGKNSHSTGKNYHSEREKFPNEREKFPLDNLGSETVTGKNSRSEREKFPLRAGNFPTSLYSNTEYIAHTSVCDAHKRERAHAREGDLEQVKNQQSEISPQAEIHGEGSAKPSTAVQVAEQPVPGVQTLPVETSALEGQGSEQLSAPLEGATAEQGTEQQRQPGSSKGKGGRKAAAKPKPALVRSRPSGPDEVEAYMRQVIAGKLQDYPLALQAIHWDLAAQKFFSHYEKTTAAHPRSKRFGWPVDKTWQDLAENWAINDLGDKYDRAAQSFMRSQQAAQPSYRQRRSTTAPLSTFEVQQATMDAAREGRQIYEAQQRLDEIAAQDPLKDEWIQSFLDDDNPLAPVSGVNQNLITHRRQ